MKLLSKFISLYLPEANLLQLIAIMVSALVFMRVFAKQISITNWWKSRRTNREMENDIWSIE